MKVSAVNSLMQTLSCQPIRQVDFDGKKKKPVPENTDTFTPSDPYTAEEKLNLACRIAAYYKTQYEALLKGQKCIA